MTSLSDEDTAATQALMSVFANDEREFDEQERAASSLADERIDWGAWWAEYAEIME